VARAPKAGGKSCGKGVFQSRRGAAPLQRRRWREQRWVFSFERNLIVR
jgi:hypothetical protein